MTPADLDAIVEMLDDGGTVCQCGADIARWECECGEMTCNDCGSPYAHGGPHYEHSRTELPRFGKEHGRALAAALREAWQERDILNDARNVLTDAVATLTQERDAALAAVDAVRADYAPRREPPTADEVRAVSRLWERPVVAMLLRTPHGAAVEYTSLLLRVADDGAVEAGDHSHAALVDAESWLPLSPAGPVAWSELAALVRGGNRG